MGDSGKGSLAAPHPIGRGDGAGAMVADARGPHCQQQLHLQLQERPLHAHARGALLQEQVASDTNPGSSTALQSPCQAVWVQQPHLICIWDAEEQRQEEHPAQDRCNEPGSAVHGH